MTKKVSIRVGMTCSGCSGAVTRILNKIEGVKNVKTDLDTKLVEVEVEDPVESGVLVDALKKWAANSGKEVTFLTEATA